MRMLAKSRIDLAVLEHMTDAAKFPDEVFGFHVQQAIEKALKGWIASLPSQYPKSHDLIVLARILAAEGKDLAKYERIEDFTAFAAQYRYEAYEGKSHPLDREATLTLVKLLVAEVAGAIQPDITDHIR
jgi:HEPN domain-containing protein